VTRARNGSGVVASATLAVLALLLAGCASASPAAGNGAGGSITVYAAASLTGTFTMLGKDFERAHPGARVRFDFGASSTLATQIGQDAPADVFASAATDDMDDVVRAGRAVRPVVFARNRMEIAVPPGNPARISSVADLARSSVRVALCDPTVPCGAVAAKVFRNAAVTLRPVSREADVKAVLAKVELGEVDAGVVYVTDVRAAGSAVAGVPIPDAVNASTDYPIATVLGSHDASLATAFADYVLSAAGRSVLAAAGFTRP
jgi:molybdate transport system substrate-binding protein